MDDERHILVVAHTGRADSLEAGIQVCRQLIEAGLTPVVSVDEFAELRSVAPDLAPVDVLGTDVTASDLELVIVLGGDGTILRAAELARGCDAPLLSVSSFIFTQIGSTYSVTQSNSKGLLTVVVSDCLGAPVKDATVTISPLPTSADRSTLSAFHR